MYKIADYWMSRYVTFPRSFRVQFLATAITPRESMLAFDSQVSLIFDMVGLGSWKDTILFLRTGATKST